MEVVEVFADNEGQEGAQVTMILERTGQRVAISLFKSNSTESRIKEGSEDLLVVDRLIKLLAQSLNTEDEDEERALEDEALDLICGVATSLDPDKTEQQEPNQSTQNLVLHDLLFPKTSHYRLEAAVEGLTLIPISANDAYGRIYGDDDDQNLGEHETEFHIDSSLPLYTSDKIEVVEQFVHGAGTVCMVRIDGRQMLCKARYDGLRDFNLQREMNSLQEISRDFQGGAQRPRVPMLLGYVKHPRFGVVLGFLREWVASKNSLNLKDLKLDGSPGSQNETCKKWGRQIKETVDKLHMVGIIWGDAKPSNVVIDLNDDAWLLDFGGGLSQGWVDEDFLNTKAGDQQAVERILKFLDVDI